MLSHREVAHLAMAKRGHTVDDFLREQTLRSRASKPQQLRVYGYWQRGKPIQGIIVSECGISHGGEMCHTCGKGWGYHHGHRCMDEGLGVFRGCDEGGYDDDETDVF